MTPVKNVTVTANYSFAQHEYTAMNRSANYPYSRVPGEVLWKTDGYGLNTCLLYTSIETNLVVTCAGRTMCNGVCTNFVSIACDSQCPVSYTHLDVYKRQV